eukprot:scaffold1364_cov75-Skeletonema_dohrnii-CCMP3373.AAC.4
MIFPKTNSAAFSLALSISAFKTLPATMAEDSCTSFATVDASGIPGWDGVEVFDFESPLTLTEALTSKMYTAGNMKSQRVYDTTDIDIYFLYQIPSKCMFDINDNKKCASVASMFQMGEKSTCFIMGGCPLSEAVNCAAVPEGCAPYTVDIGAHWELKTSTERGNEGTCNDLIVNKDDEFADGPYCRVDDNFGASPGNEWSGAWDFTGNATDGAEGYYICETSRSLTTPSPETDNQLTPGTEVNFGVSFWLGWTDAGHVVTGCFEDWAGLRLVDENGDATPVFDDVGGEEESAEPKESGSDMETAFTPAPSGTAFISISSIVGAAYTFATAAVATYVIVIIHSTTSTMKVRAFALPLSLLCGTTVSMAAMSNSTSSSSPHKPLALVHYPLNPTIPCGDGSPAGFYTDAYITPDGIKNKNHVINFMGGGGCGSNSSCQAIWEQQPYMLSSLFEPSMIDGATILSNDASENPTMASFTKWNVPYCSQDLWLGNVSQSDNFIRSGSKIVEAVLAHWLDEVSEAQVVIDTLVISGVSAGGMAVLNHFLAFQTVAQAAGVESLRLILDASLYPDGIDTDFSDLMKQVVDPQQHPLCFEEWTSKLQLQHESLSRLPCCLSTHCMLRHSNGLSEWARSSPNSSVLSNQSGLHTQMLLIDSAYDSLQNFLELSSDTSPRNAVPSGGISSLDGVASTTFNIAEYAGERKSRVVETVFGGGKQLGPNVFWAMTSSLGHNALIPSIDLSSRLCDAMQAAESSCEGARDCVFSNYPGGIFPVCNATGSGLKLPLGNGLNMTLWTTTESWNLVKVNGQSIRDVISLFVTSALGSSSSSSSTLLIDSCPGPNCVPQDSTEENPAQSLIEMDNVFTPISIWLRILVTIILSSMPLCFLLSVCGCGIGGGKQTQTDNKSQVPEKTRSKPCRKSLYLNGLSVFSSSGDKILDDVSVDFKCSTLNCLLGKSGSGKSCFLGVLSRQLRSNLQVQYKNGTDLSRMSCTYMRQQDVGMKNMTPNEYLSTTARVYGTCKDRLDFILDLVRPFFPVKTETSENGDTIVSLDPFNNVPLKELSGGQRRMISIATALFQEFFHPLYHLTKILPVNLCHSTFHRGQLQLRKF